MIVRINSPGGSPVQAGQINSEIRRLRGLYPKVPAVRGGGGHLRLRRVLRRGGRRSSIYVDQASLVGSIGVLMDGFGFTGTMEKLGVETALAHRGRQQRIPRSVFTAESRSRRSSRKKMLAEIHRQFIDVV